MQNRTGFIFDESYLWHDTGSGALSLPAGGWLEADVYAENPDTKRRIKSLIDRSGYSKELDRITPSVVTQEDLKETHSADYIEKIKEMSDTPRGGMAGEEAIVGPGSYEIACLSAGGGIAAVDKVMSGEVDNAYALTRPPGHHAEEDKGMGFCLFNNVAIAARYARKTYGLNRVMILDWDVHHGNGTEQSFYDDPNILFVSIHQELNYPPKSGQVDKTGKGEGEGYNINIPLPAGTGDEGYIHTLENVVAPLVDQFQPELILISAGQDASIFDPLGRMMVTADGYKRMAIFMKKLAEKHCQGRLIALHEGGYSAPYVPFCTLRIIEALKGKDSKVEEEPFQYIVKEMPTELNTHQQSAVSNVIEEHSGRWSFHNTMQ
ncbi:class II histone deacetylase [Salicibibacter cibarius]|uniref:Class II histone deacetylase n=1 Tax=Salicibibacter cibarius TaxID=2743000 RepID=A0A7T7CBB0_9BACI|nr:class II histone deacetylase [Salicibibacter cibarius]QQK75779.1 class II histone deacetylase [Salicibibacter cibarius]